MPVALKGSTSGQVTLDVPATAGTNTLTLPAKTGNIITSADSGTVTTTMLASGAITRAILPAGAILQVISVNKNDQFSTTSASYVTVTGLSTSITPTSSTSKILVIAQIVCGLSGTSNDGVFQLVRGSTTIGSTDMFASAAGQAVAYQGYNWCYPYLDSPATTSSTTYSIQGKSYSGNTLYVNRRPIDTAFTYASSLTLIEVAA